MAAPVNSPEQCREEASDLQRHLATVFGYCEGYVAVRMLRENGTPVGKPLSRYLPLDDKLEASVGALAQTSADDMRGLYVVPCTIHEPGNARADNIHQTCVIPCDLDHGDIAAKQAHLEHHLGPASMVVLSGGRTDEGQTKRHLYWRLTEACSGDDLETVGRVRRLIIAAVDADRAFERLTQPIRIAGSIHCKNGKQTPVRIETSCDCEHDLDELLEAAETMPRLPGLPSKRMTIDQGPAGVPFAERQTRTVSEGGKDAETRFDALSGTIGHWIRQARLGSASLGEARRAVADYNMAMVQPPWSAERLSREFEALLQRDRASYPEAWVNGQQQPSHEDADTIPPPQHSEDHLAEAFVSQRGNDWRYVAAWGQWLHWTRTHWQVDDTQQVLDDVRRVCRNGAQDLKPGEARRIASARTIKAVERIASSDRRLALGTDAWDSRPGLLNTPSGTLNLETGEIFPARQADHLTQITSVSSDKTSSAWRGFLEQITGGDADLVAYLARVCGYCLTGETSEQAFFFFHGEGGNGKSVFVQTIAKAMGSYAATAPLDSFTVSRNTSHPTDLAGLRGKRLVTVTETEQGRSWAESRIKTITGGDPVRARLLYRDFFEFTPSFKLVVVGNHRPQLTSVGHAMRRRLQLVPFSITIPDDQREKNLAARLEQDLDGVLGWMLDGYRDWRSKGLAPPDGVVRASEEYFAEEDLFGQWIGEQCDVDQRSSAPARSLYESWSTWADASGVERGSKKHFGEALRSRGFQSRHTRSGSVWQGLKPRTTLGGAGG